MDDLTLALHRWVGFRTFEYAEHLEIVCAFEGRQYLRAHWDEMTDEQREAVAAADAWAEAHPERFMPSLTLPGNRLPDEHYARQYAVRHGYTYPAVPEDPRAVWLRQRDDEAEE